jgi:hypothetical protein
VKILENGETVWDGELLEQSSGILNAKKNDASVLNSLEAGNYKFTVSGN